MTALSIKHRGRHPEAKNVPRSAYPKIYGLYLSGKMCARDIGKEWGIGASGVRSLVQRCKKDPSLLEVSDAMRDQ